MLYHEIHEKMRTTFDKTTDVGINDELGISIEKINFKSVGAQGVLSGSDILCCSHHQHDFEKFDKSTIVSDHYLLDVPDYYIEENLTYTLSIIKKKDVEVVDDLIILFHGLNEKKWDKYLPWA